MEPKANTGRPVDGSRTWLPQISAAAQRLGGRRLGWRRSSVASCCGDALVAAERFVARRRTSRPSALGEADGRLDPAGQRVGDECLVVAGPVGGRAARRRARGRPTKSGRASRRASVARSSVSPITRRAGPAAPNSRVATSATSARCSASVPSTGQGRRGADALEPVGAAGVADPPARAAPRRRPGGPGRCAARRGRGTADPAALRRAGARRPGQDQLQHHVVGEQDVRRVVDDRLALLVASPGRCTARNVTGPRRRDSRPEELLQLSSWLLARAFIG